MLKRLLVVALLLMFGISTVSAQFNKAQLDAISKLQYKVTMIGDALVGVRADGKSDNYGFSNIASLIKQTGSKGLTPDWNFTATFTPIGLGTIYDLCSNGSTVQIWQDPATPDNIHIAVVHAPLGDGTSFPTRRTKYFYSSDRGVTWTYVSDVPSGVKSGFPSVTGFTDGTALVVNHSADGAPGATVMQAYKDAFAGLGSFTRLTPPLNNGGGNIALEPIWPRALVLQTSSPVNKFLMVGSYSSTAPETDSTYYIFNTSYDATPGTWATPYTYLPADQAETYALGLGADGRIGIAFKNNDSKNPESYADVWFIESTNNGTSFSSPIKIFDANFGAGGDSLGLIRGIGITYAANSPKVVFETIKQSPDAASYFPGAPAKIRFWSPTLPGTDPNKSIVIADTTMIGWFPYVGVNDVMSSMSRPNIGVSANGNVLFATFNVPADFVGGSVDTTTFMDIYMTVSGNGGATWKTPVKVNPTTPVRDWRYTSISPKNDNNSTTYYANLVTLSGLIPGSYVNGSGNGESLEPYVFVRVAIPASEVSVNQLSTEVPSSFSLSQNYPNPFNPTTNIKFALSKAGMVTLKVYDMLGKEVSTLVNENLGVGTFEYKFDASNLTSGIYFYTIKANGFSETKKMMLIK